MEAILNFDSAERKGAELNYMKVELQSVLKREIKARHLTINALARHCNIPISVLHGWVNGVLPSAKNLCHLADLAKHLDLPISVLLFDRYDNNSTKVAVLKSEFEDGGSRYRLSVEKIR